MILKNIAQAEVIDLKDCVTYAEGQVVSKTLIQNDGVGITIFAFAKGEVSVLTNQKVTRL